MAKRRYTAPNEQEMEQFIDARPVNLPNCRRSKRTVIKSGPRTYKYATVLEFTKPDSDEVSSRRLTLNSHEFTVFGGLDLSQNPREQWFCEDQEIRKLHAFLGALDEIQTDGRHVVVPETQIESFRVFMERLEDTDLSTPQLLELIKALAERASDIRELPELGEANKLRMVAAAIRVAHRHNALCELQALIDEGATELKFQDLLSRNWWMFGCHYVEQITRREWTTDETIDLLLRSADGYFDLIELKRSNANFLKQDHGKWIVGAQVSDAVTQAAHYMSKIEQIYDTIFNNHGVDLYRLKARVLIGYISPDDPDARQKRAAIRMFNSHLSRIEVVTFDELVRIAQNVIDSNAGESGQESVHRDVF